MTPVTIWAVFSAPPNAKIRPDTKPATATHSFLEVSLRFQSIFLVCNSFQSLSTISKNRAFSSAVYVSGKLLMYLIAYLLRFSFLAFQR